MNIYQKMSAITSDLSAVAKNLMVGEGRNSYKAVGEADVLAAVKPLEAKHGVYSYPLTREIIASDILTKTSEYNGQKRETSVYFLRLHTIYRFVNTDEPTEYIDIDTYGDGVDSGDKAPGKAMTYADKYALLKAYKIITGEDPDQYKSEEEKVVSKPRTKKEKAPEPKAAKETIDADAVNALMDKLGDESGLAVNIAKIYNVNSLGEMTYTQMKHLLANWDKVMMMARVR